MVAEAAGAVVGYFDFRNSLIATKISTIPPISISKYFIEISIIELGSYAALSDLQSSPLARERESGYSSWDLQ